jgi:hypothetical protein
MVSSQALPCREQLAGSAALSNLERLRHLSSLANSRISCGIAYLVQELEVVHLCQFSNLQLVATLAVLLGA